ncbi:hypothetical protein [Apilactobacillus micheneri]|uniref:hypothetical protein n=1 Tax=Apilactobacillus micheneri TaxID=1899430 RepID=UPI001126FC65|nr:hypothetical protein [Apilactobacillus micheneri]TPR50775.1 hypothetical protein DY126_06920 [Apilactobacillus micheneri]
MASVIERYKVVRLILKNLRNNLTKEKFYNEPLNINDLQSNASPTIIANYLFLTFGFFDTDMKISKYINHLKLNYLNMYQDELAYYTNNSNVKILHTIDKVKKQFLEEQNNNEQCLYRGTQVPGILDRIVSDPSNFHLTKLSAHQIYQKYVTKFDNYSSEKDIIVSGLNRFMMESDVSTFHFEEFIKFMGASLDEQKLRRIARTLMYYLSVLQVTNPFETYNNLELANGSPYNNMNDNKQRLIIMKKIRPIIFSLTYYNVKDVFFYNYGRYFNYYKIDDAPFESIDPITTKFLILLLKELFNEI